MANINVGVSGSTTIATSGDDVIMATVTLDEVFTLTAKPEPEPATKVARVIEPIPEPELGAIDAGDGVDAVTLAADAAVDGDTYDATTGVYTTAGGLGGTVTAAESITFKNGTLDLTSTDAQYLLVGNNSKTLSSGNSSTGIIPILGEADLLKFDGTTVAADAADDWTITGVNGTAVTVNGGAVSTAAGTVSLVALEFERAPRSIDQENVPSDTNAEAINYKVSSTFLATMTAGGDDAEDVLTLTLTNGDGDTAEVEYTIIIEAPSLVATVNADTLVEFTGGDLLPGDDYATGDAGADTIFGNDGNDVIFAGAEDDAAGDDLFVGGDGADTIGGGLGDDILIGDSHENGKSEFTFGDIASDDGTDKLYGGAGDDVMVGGSYDGKGLYPATASALFDNGVRLRGDVNITGTEANVMYGGDGDDAMVGAGGNDVMGGGIGNDAINGLGGDDTIYANDGNDFINGFDGLDKLYGGDGNDGILGGSGNDVMYGGEGKDKLYGDGDNDTLFGGAGVDKLDGGSSKDKLYGGAGVDALVGGEGDDKLYGGEGDDSLYGESGQDTFVFVAGDGTDTIFDWGTGGDSDKMDVSAFGTTFAALSANNIYSIEVGGNFETYVQLDADTTVVLETNNALTLEAADFTFEVDQIL